MAVLSLERERLIDGLKDAFSGELKEFQGRGAMAELNTGMDACWEGWITSLPSGATSKVCKVSGSVDVVSF